MSPEPATYHDVCGRFGGPLRASPTNAGWETSSGPSRRADGRAKGPGWLRLSNSRLSNRIVSGSINDRHGPAGAVATQHDRRAPMPLLGLKADAPARPGDTPVQISPEACNNSGRSRYKPVAICNCQFVLSVTFGLSLGPRPAVAFFTFRFCLFFLPPF